MRLQRGCLGYWHGLGNCASVRLPLAHCEICLPVHGLSCSALSITFGKFTKDCKATSLWHQPMNSTTSVISERLMVMSARLSNGRVELFLLCIGVMWIAVDRGVGETQ